MKPAVIYVRTSTEEQNPENQLDDCKALAATLDLNDYDVLEEKGSAWKDSAERPAFESIRQAALKGEVKHLLVWDFDRLFRNRKKTLAFVKEYGKLGLKVHSHRQQWLEQLNRVPAPWNEIMSDFLLNVLAWIGEEESQKKSERVKAAYQRMSRDKRCKKWGRPEVFINESRLRALKGQGLSIRQIAKELGVSREKVRLTLTIKG